MNNVFGRKDLMRNHAITLKLALLALVAATLFIPPADAKMGLFASSSQRRRWSRAEASDASY